MELNLIKKINKTQYGEKSMKKNVKRTKKQRAKKMENDILANVNHKQLADLLRKFATEKPINYLIFMLETLIELLAEKKIINPKRLMLHVWHKKDITEKYLKAQEEAKKQKEDKENTEKESE